MLTLGLIVRCLFTFSGLLSISLSIYASWDNILKISELLYKPPSSTDVERAWVEGYSFLKLTLSTKSWITSAKQDVMQYSALFWYTQQMRYRLQRDGLILIVLRFWCKPKCTECWKRLNDSNWCKRPFRCRGVRLPTWASSWRFYWKELVPWQIHV